MASTHIVETKLAWPYWEDRGAAETNQTMTLRDGRRLGFAEFGDPSGKPVFFFHGGAGSRLEHPANVCALGARVICVDRPGHGLSDFKPDRELLEWPDDVAQLADYLGLATFHVLGWSAGGPHALACAYQQPDRLRAAAVAASPGPMNHPGSRNGVKLPSRAFIFAARKFPWLIGRLRKVASDSVLSDPMKAKQQYISSIPARDRKRLQQSGNFNMMFADIREGYRQGWQGVAHDDVIIMQDWGFDPSDIEVRIDIWHGDEDRSVPAQASEYLHERIANSRATFLTGEGHLFLLHYWCKVVTELISDQCGHPVGHFRDGQSGRA